MIFIEMNVCKENKMVYKVWFDLYIGREMESGCNGLYLTIPTQHVFYPKSTDQLQEKLSFTTFFAADDQLIS